jgi:succinoglycan biosynthesis protein ExoM
MKWPTDGDAIRDNDAPVGDEKGGIAASVVILTFQRPAFACRAVESVLGQRGLDRPIEILVVDNDAEGSARAAIAALARRSQAGDGPPIRYVAEPRAGISHARNTGVAVAAGEFIAFLDDDEIAGPDWLASFLATAHRFAADIVVGPVRPIFPEGARVSAYATGVYTRDAKLPSGSVVRWGGIGNALLRKARCFREPVPFDPRLGLTGGEDSIFLEQAVQAGCKLVWCADAAVRETVPADKLLPGYLLRRAFRAGQTTSFGPSALAAPRWSGVIGWMVVGSLQCVVYGPAGLALRLAGHPAWLPITAKAASGLGKVLWHPALHIRNYRLGAPRAARR